MPLPHPIRLLLALLCSWSAPGRAANDPPAGYYNGTAGLSGAQLKAALHAQVDNHTDITYDGVWGALKVIDQDPNNSANVLLIYSGDSRAKSLQDTGTDTQNFWNREHVWPVSLGPASTDSDAGSDLHHVFASDKNVNANRGNLPFDTVGSGSGTQSDPEAPLSRYSSSAYMPRDADKGRVARALFYMAVRYEANDDVPGVGDLELQESLSVSSPRMARLSTLLTWHRQFPPTEAERLRNHRIYSNYQGNRNPFIDNPLFVDQVFNNDSAFTAWRRPHFTSAEISSSPHVSGPTADPDGDGIPNRLEYLFNLAPRTADTGTEGRLSVAFLPPASQGGAARLALSYRRHRYATDLTVRHESSADLVTWTEFTPGATTTTYVDSLTDLMTVETTPSGARRFVRLRVE